MLDIQNLKRFLLRLQLFTVFVSWNLLSITVWGYVLIHWSFLKQLIFCFRAQRQYFSTFCQLFSEKNLIMIKILQYKTKHHDGKNTESMLLDWDLLSSHLYPIHPAPHPPSHRPVKWLHVVLALQCPTHGWVQFSPYHPSLHSFH